MSGIRTFASMVIALGACATADNGGGGNGDVDAPGTNIDAPGGGNVDAPGGNVDAPTTPIDAPAGNVDAALQTITLSQNSSMTITAANTISCNKGSPGFVTAENSYYRAFTLSTFGVVRPFTAQRVDFGIESANAEVGTTQTIQVRLYTVNGTFPSGTLTSVAGQNVTVNDTTVGVVNSVMLSPTPVIQPNATLVAEIFVPDGDVDNNNVGNSIFIGSNTAAETGPSYIRAPATGCAITTPTDMASAPLNAPNVNIVLTVTGVF